VVVVGGGDGGGAADAISFMSSLLEQDLAFDYPGKLRPHWNPLLLSQTDLDVLRPQTTTIPEAKQFIGHL
jgi:hypothetical protein